ncbi:unnamed protein product [Bodo saltans]|uniref:ABC transporter n=1 Tax=Bodo saltans TaxID=75058 RepID=A0A0S4J4A2_BODSA|nr:unnamed protein product [Bodo saltans]|eukprot:CUG86232.1 unnamed protein product [Bodo saltans]
MIDTPSLSDFYDLRIVFISCVWLAIIVNVVSALHRCRRDLLPAPLLFHFVSHAAMGAEVFAIIYAASSHPGTISSIEDPDAQRLSVALQWTQRVSVLVWLILSRWLYYFVPRGVVGFVILLPVISEWARVSLQLLSPDDLEPAQFSVDCIIVVLQCVSFCSVLGWKWLFATDVELLFRQIPESPQTHHHHESDEDRHHAGSHLPRHTSGDGTRIADILPLENSIAIEGAEEDMRAHWQRRGSIGWSLWSRWKGTLATLAGVRLVFDILSLLPAYLLRVLIDNLSDSDSTSSHDLRVSCVIVALLVLSSVVGTLMRSHYSLKLQRISLYNRGLLSDVILKHVIRTRTSRLMSSSSANHDQDQQPTGQGGESNGASHQSHKTQGDILNHLTVDSQRVADGLSGLYDLWALPLQTGLTLYLLYVQVSFAFVAGIVITVALIPVNMVLAKKISKVQSKMLAHNDERVLRINEVMNNMIYVKMCGWRPMMAGWIREPREQYMRCLRWVKMLDALCVFFWATTPVFVSLATFALYIGFGGTLTPGRAVAALTLFNSLILPLNAYPWVINGTVEAYVSLKRLQGFLGPFVRLESQCIRAVSQHIRPPSVWPTPSASDGTTSDDSRGVGENSEESDHDESAPLTKQTTDGKKNKISSTIKSKFGQKKRRHVIGSLNQDAFGSPSQERSIPSIFNSGRRGASRTSADDDGSVARLDEVSNIFISMEKVGFAHARSTQQHQNGHEEQDEDDDMHRDVNEAHHVSARSWHHTSSSRGGGGLSSSSLPFRIEVPRFVLRSNECVAIVGPSGSGKSTFLSGLAGELWRVGGNNSGGSGGGLYVVRRDSMALVEQTPFLTLGSIKHNVLCGLPFRKDAFDRVMKMCALDVDLREFPEKENTMLADRGTGLSGGQKYRVALARGLYAEKSVTLVDDGLGSLDVEVANHVVDHVFSAIPQQAGRSIIVVTHSPDLIARAHRVYKADGNKLVELSHLEREFYLQRELPTSPRAARLTSSSTTGEDAEHEQTGMGDRHASSLQETLDASPTPANPTSIGTTQIGVQLSEASQSLAPPKKAGGGGGSLSTQSNNAHLEVSEHGQISWTSFRYYLSRVGIVVAFVVVVFIAAMQAARNLGDWFIAVWVSDTNAAGSQLIQTLGILAAVNAVLAIVRGVSFALAGLSAARVIHEELLSSILGASYHFFMKTSPGRLINRLSRDVYNVDDSLPFIINILLAQSFLLFGSLAIIIINSSWIVILLLLPIAVINYWIQKPYRRVSREVKRLESAARSPMIDDLRRILEGGAVYRTMGPETMSHIHKKSRSAISAFLRTNSNLLLLNTWFGIRLQLLGSVILAAVGLVAVYFHSPERAASLGLALAYVAPLTSYISGLLSAFADTEKQFVSVERIVEYLNCESEATSLDPSYQLPTLASSSASAAASAPLSISTKQRHPQHINLHGAVWPLFGTVQFNDVSLRYDADGPLVLRNVTFQVDAGEKIAVVGRTGAGKTSLFVALLRLLRLQKGSILIDSEDIQMLDPEQLRQRLAVFPQDPFLFHGTIRDNVDPFRKATDDEIQNVLRRVQLGQLRMTFMVEEGGKNLSCGERYLVALARVVLQESCILLLDEPSAKMDATSESMLWDNIDATFRDCTVITVTHNLNRIDWFDRVVVMDRGVMIGYGTPADMRREGIGPFGAL